MLKAADTDCSGEIDYTEFLAAALDHKIYMKDEYLKLIKDINLSEYFITSKAVAKSMTSNNKFFKLDGVKDISVLVKKAKGRKCSRCWKILDSPCERNNCGLKS